MGKQVNTNVHMSKYTPPKGPAFSEIAPFTDLPLLVFEGTIHLPSNTVTTIDTHNRYCTSQNLQGFITLGIIRVNNQREFGLRARCIIQVK